jgi:predicted nucleic acid-binding protein
MTFFVDANVLIYAATEGPAREGCARVLTAVATGAAEGRTSPAVLEEVWHVAERRYQGRLDGLVERAVAIFSPLLPVTEEALVRALAIDAPSLGANDKLHAGTCAAEGIGVVLTADAAFDGVPGLQRVDPFDPAALDLLLGPS